MIQVPLVTERLCYFGLSKIWIANAIFRLLPIDCDSLSSATTVKHAMPVGMIKYRTISAIEFRFPLAVFYAALSSRVCLICELRWKK